MSKRRRKLTAWFFLVIFSVETLTPGVTYALTSGPAQPEMQQFQPAGTGDLVDLFTGDLNYNIPLGDVGGYPLNLAYHSGTGIDDEASWVGTGWSLNPGSIDRQMRGLPDDFNGDLVTTEYRRKDFLKIGGKVVLKGSLLGWEVGKAGLGVTVYRDNYYGIGAGVSASLGFSLAKNKQTALTAGLGINSDTRDGLSLTPSLSLSSGYDFWTQEPSRQLSGSFTYNTRSGLKNVSLRSSFSAAAGTTSLGTRLSATKYFGQSYVPSIAHSTVSQGYTLSTDAGLTIFGVYLGPGSAGFVYSEKVAENVIATPAYGYMNYVNGRKNRNALLDFNREKDGVFIPSAPAIPVPVATQDLFMATSQAGSGQFRSFFNGNYIVFDKANYNNTTNLEGGVTVGVGNFLKSGGRVDFASGGSSSGKWTSNNEYLGKGEAVYDPAVNPLEEATYFKQNGELTRADDPYLGYIKNENVVRVGINNKQRIFKGAKAFKIFDSRENGQEAIPDNINLKRVFRDKRPNAVSFLTALQAQKFGLDKKINDVDRVLGYRKAHHLSEITVTNEGGNRMVYGIPVYNVSQEDVTFSVDRPLDPATYENATRTGQIAYSLSNGKPDFNHGRDAMYSSQALPAYPASFLLTGILSPDYRDMKGDGITDDDPGTAVKFGYTRLANSYQWRAPYTANTASYNEGFTSDFKDDKASYVHGSKEVWYLNKIESKTMVAVFETSNREDGLGVNNENGGKSTSIKLQKLDRIKIYSKAAWAKYGPGNPSLIPIRTIHFEYDYSLCPGVENNSNQAVNVPDPANPNAQINLNSEGGKLTLKKVYFTFGDNERGKSNPYEFEYDMRLISSIPGITSSPNAGESTDHYTQRQQDRWGTYKQSWYNRLVSNGGSLAMKMNNSEFPYALQDKTLADRFASKWQLNKIVTPTGSTITVDYESDDYAYVQNRRAMQMCFVQGIGNSIGSSGTGLINAGGFTVQLPVPVTGANKLDEFRKAYLQGADGSLMDKIYYKISTKIDGSPRHFEYVMGYAEVDLQACTVSGDGATAFIGIKKIKNKNAVAKAGWQMMKADLPQLAYDNYDNSDATTISANIWAAIKSVISAVGNVGELISPFEATAERKGFCNEIDLTKSMVRLYTPTSKKLGGGCRVKQLTIKDGWHDMTDGARKEAGYGQVYTYATTNAAGKEISSGVAAYEPAIGNEENPFHEPDNYTEKVHWSTDRYHYIEKPYCETFFPAPSVGYSKVTVTSFGDDYVRTGTLEKHTGYIENEFYTARDFPTQVDNLLLEQNNYENSLLLKLFSSTYVNRVVTSQGFKVEINDMHGKPKSIKVFDRGGSLISSTENFYNVVDENAETKQLDNKVDVLEANGDITEKVLIGTNMDFVTDVRESANESVGTSIGAYGGTMIIPIGFFPIKIPYAAINFSYNITEDSYHSISSVKVIHRYGILRKVRVTQNGSTAVTENMLWDGETGEVVLTRIQNEFNNYNYAFSYPAYMTADGMSGAYKNVGAVFPNFLAGSNGKISPLFTSYLVPGDELISLNTNQKGWVISSTVDNVAGLYLVDAVGEMELAIGPYMVLRSGRRNILGASAGSVICMNDPRVPNSAGGRKIELDVDKKILDAKALTYKDEWAVAVPPQFRPVPVPADEFCPNDCLRDFFYGAMVKVIQTSGSGTRRGLFAQQSDNLKVGPLMLKYQDRPACYTFAGQPASSSAYYLNTLHTVSLPGGVTRYEIRPGDMAQFGIFQIVFDEVSTQFNDMINSNMSEAAMLNELNATMPPLQLPQYCLAPESYYSPVEGDWRDRYCKDRLVFRKFTGNCSDARWSCDWQRCPNTTLMKWHLVAPPEYAQYVNKCVDPLTVPVNPYVTGLLGNWHPEKPFAHVVNRVQVTGLPDLNGSTDIRKSGYYASFKPFWIFQQTGGLTKNSINELDPAERWILGGQSVYYDQKGNEIESVDALKQYKAALFGYRESVATAIASNARHNEIAFDGFEDYDFQLQSGLQEDCPMPRHFDLGLTGQVGGTWCGNGGCISANKAHSGKYSYNLSGATIYSKTTSGNSQPPSPVLGYDAQGRYKLLNNELANGFNPVNGKKYVLSLWVNDNMPNTNRINGLSVSINNQDKQVGQIDVPVVEGWKHLEVTFTAGSTFNLQLAASGGNIYVDDIRVHPYDSHLASFVYDDVTMRLMAQLDENNFATFYEYDDEGTPIRVKKETERGIMTIKENRQFFRKRN